MIKVADNHPDATSAGLHKKCPGIAGAKYISIAT